MHKFLGYFLSGLIVCTAHTQSPSIQYNELVSSIVTDEFIQDAIAKGEQYVEKYTAPEFLDRIINADEIKKQEQVDFNKKLLLDASDYSLPIGIYVVDVMNIAHLGASWMLEWWLYNTLTQSFATTIIHDLINQQDTAESYEPLQFSVFGKKIIATAIAYTLANVACERSKEYLLLDSTDLNNQNPKAIYSVIQNKIQAYATSPLSPHVLTKAINGVFKKFGLLPAWTEQFKFQVTKDSLTLLLWLAWYEYRVICPALEKRLADDMEYLNPMIQHIRTITQNKHPSAEEKLEVTELTRVLHFFVTQSITMPFGQWLVFKTTHISTWQGVANILVATPAWYRLGTWAYNIYQEITYGTSHEVPEDSV